MSQSSSSTVTSIQRSLPSSTIGSPIRPLRVAIYFNLKKRQQFLTPLFNQSYYDIPTNHQTNDRQPIQRMEIIIIETDDELERKGPFDILLMKLTDLMTTATFGHETSAQLEAQASIKRVQSIIATNQAQQPFTVIEPMERVQQLLNRATIQSLVKDMNMTDDTTNGLRCTIPSACLYQPVLRSTSAASSSSLTTIGGMTLHRTLPANLTYPIICKSLAACGTPGSHRMYILQQPQDFELLNKHESTFSYSSTDNSTPPTSVQPIWLLQQYINHGAVIYKVYVLDEEVHVIAKPSLPDLHSSSPSYYMNSQDMILHTLSMTSPASASTSSSSTSPLTVPAAIEAIARSCAIKLRTQLQLSLFGFDLIQSVESASTTSTSTSSATPMYYLIDINYFPSYKTLTDLPQKLLAICLKQHQQTCRQRDLNRANNVNAISVSTSAPSSTATATHSNLPDPSILIRAAHVGRTPPPPYPEYQSYGRGKAVGVKGKVVWAGLKVFGAMEFVGEVFADFFGLYDSRYQYVVDAYERNKRELEFERAERAAARREQREEEQQRVEASEPSHLRAEQNRREEIERHQLKESTRSTTLTSTASSKDVPIVDLV